MIERKLGAVRSAAPAPGNDGFLVLSLRIEDPRVNSHVWITRQNRWHNRAPVVGRDSIEREAIHAANSLHVGRLGNPISGRSKGASQRAGVGPHVKNARSQARRIQTNERRTVRPRKTQRIVRIRAIEHFS